MATREISRGVIGAPYFLSLNVVKNEMIFAGYLLVLLLILLSFNLTLMYIVGYSFIVCICLKKWHNGSIKTALLCVLNLTL